MNTSDTAGLPVSVREECELHLQNGHFDDAILTALKWTEARLSWAAGGQPRLFGTKAVRGALDPNDGTIRFGNNREQAGAADLLCGLMVLYRNPAAHDFPPLTAAEARAVIDLADAQLSRIFRGIARSAANALGTPVAQVVVLAVADFDGDKENELLAAALSSDGKPSRIVVLKNRTHGFLARVVLENAEHTLAVEARDVDLDGRHEVLIYDGSGGPGASLSILRWTSDGTTEVARIGADLPTFGWSQPDGNGAHQLLVTGRTFGTDAVWRRESRTFSWRGGAFVETSRGEGEWSEPPTPPSP